MFGIFRRKGKTIDQIANEIDGFGGSIVAGRAVTEKTALEVSTVLACVDVIASGCAVPEISVLRDLGKGKTAPATDVKAYRLLRRRPNELQTSYEFRDTLTMHAALAGNGYALPVRDVRNDEVIELLPLMPHQVMVDQRDRYGLLYTVADEFGPIGQFRHDQILHIRNHSWDRVRGLPSVRIAAKAIGLAMAAEENLVRLHENGGRPSGVLQSDEALSPEVVERIKSGWERFTRGAKRSATAILDRGLKYQPVSMSSVDAQTLETRRHQVEEICRAFGVFPIMVGHADKTATYASAEAFFAANNRKTVAKWQTNWRQKLDEFVLDGDGPLFVQFENEEIRTANLKDQGEFFAKALGTGGGVPYMTVNEVREVRGLPPIAGGDVLKEPVASTQTDNQGGNDGTEPEDRPGADDEE